VVGAVEADFMEAGPVVSMAACGAPMCAADIGGREAGMVSRVVAMATDQYPAGR
jgi:hypothetical protein